ncbi:MAG: AMP-binding protein [Candidatus Heimdallarchaeota archaeon]|nr:AMP-binding protein [Candidatus Heimdallarchaeota archaeon]MBY8995188.1 AMP-binding protein [Candidatus Heimdallarchaeota archaeon]
MARWQTLYHSKIPAEIDIPKDKSLSSLFFDSVEKAGKSPFLYFQGKMTTYEESARIVKKLANSLSELGVKKGDRVAILMANCPQYVHSYLSVLSLGGVIVALSSLASSKEIEFQLKDSGSKILITHDLFLDRVRPIQSKTKLQHVVVSSVADALSPIKGFLYKNVIARKNPKPSKEDLIYKDLVKNGAETDIKVKMKPIEDLAALQYTGGTTGTPKAAMLTHYNLLSQAIVLDYWMEWIGGQIPGVQSTNLASLPLSHIFGLTTAFIWPMSIAGSISLIPDPRKLEEVMKTVQDHKIHFFMAVPTLYQKIAEHPKVSDYDWSSLRCGISGGSALHTSVMDDFEKKTGALLVEGYGLSEASPVTHVNPLDVKLRKIGIGLPIPNTQAKIIDINTGKDIPEEFDDDGLTKEGELLVKGPQVMKGYWKKPEETANVFTKDGWLKTGDVVRMNEKGFFTIVDRLKDCIFTSGYQVWPLEVESALCDHPDISLVAVIPFKDESLNEVIRAVIVAAEGAPEHDHATLKAYCKNIMAPYKVPKEFEYRKELPLSPVGKVLRRPLKEEEAAKVKVSSK